MHARYVNNYMDSVRFTLNDCQVFKPREIIFFYLQNKYMMWFGAITFTSCVSYIIYMRSQWKHEKVYTAIDDNDELVLRKKRSGWD